MSEMVEVPFGDNPSEQATLLLAAAEDLDLDQQVVATTTGAFLVPSEVAEAAFPKPKRQSKSKPTSEE